MLTIARLFGKSPFAPLQTHMNRVGSCMEKLTKIFESLVNKETDKIERLAQELSQLEHEADLTKNDIRNHLPKSLFMPIDRGHFLEILAIQDSIADMAEAVGITLALRPLASYEVFQERLTEFFVKSAEVFWEAKRIIEEIDELLESAFGGIEAEKVKLMVEETAFKEHQAQKQQQQLLKKLFNEGDHLSAPAFLHWLRVVEDIGEIAHRSEKLANRIRMVLELK
ncbi:MAG: TIGR00153 family protein [Verrucomicrobia bacterium]|nr:TIGR00153 family protein [Verrucomicrobiota bacterium]